MMKSRYDKRLSNGGHHEKKLFPYKKNFLVLFSETVLLSRKAFYYDDANQSHKKSYKTIFKQKWSIYDSPLYFFDILKRP